MTDKESEQLAIPVVTNPWHRDWSTMRYKKAAQGRQLPRQMRQQHKHTQR